jgi:hypothetical protein
LQLKNPLVSFGKKIMKMEQEAIISKTIENIQRFPFTQQIEVSDFMEFLMKKTEEQIINEGIKNLASNSESFSFLNEEPDLYTVNDLKLKY